MKNLFATLLCTLVSLSAVFSQGAFQQVYYSSNHSVAPTDVLETVDHNLLFTGAYSTPTKSMGFLVKTDFDGNQQWTRTSDFGFTGKLSHVVEAGGFYYVVGSINTGIVFSCPLIKISTDGDIIWKKRLDYRDFTVPSAFIKTNDGGLLIAGTADDDSTAMHSFVVKTDTSGNILWKKSYTHHATRDFQLHDAIQNADGTYYITGSANDPAAPFSKVSFIALLDSVGGIIWSKQIESGNRFVGFQKLLPTTANGCYAAGIFQNGNKNICLAKLDNTGVVTFTKSYTITGGDIHLRGLNYNGSDIVFAGIHEKTANPDTDILVFRTSITGALLTARTTGNTAAEEACEIIPYTGNGRLLMVGKREADTRNQVLTTILTNDLQSPCNNNPITITVTDEAIAANNLAVISGNGGNLTPGLFNAPAITLSDSTVCGVGVGIAELNNSDFEIFPNPASSEFNIQGLKSTPGSELRICDVLGKQVYVTQLSGGTLCFKLQNLNLEDGLYIVQWNDGRVTLSKKLLIKR